MLTVKPYEEKYKEDVRRVCINTGPVSARSDKAQANYILSTYCDYYIEVEGRNCFVAVDENDTAQGYIFCAEDYTQFKKDFREYIERAGQSGFIKKVYAWGECFIVGLYKRTYPAHLHIDINPGYQRSGTGTQLMSTLINHLRQKHVTGVMLIVGAGNEKGRNFYKKYGFAECKKISEGVVMGYKIR